MTLGAVTLGAVTLGRVTRVGVGLMACVGPMIRAASVATVGVRLARVLVARPPVERATVPGAPITVVVPARNEAQRIAPLLSALSTAPGVDSVIVVDDRSDDGTASIAREAGADVIVGTEPPIGWVGKTWALDQGIRAADTEWVVTFDADVVPDPDLPASAVVRALTDHLDYVTLAGRAELSRGRWLHASLLNQLVYRFGPPGSTRRLASGQCIAGRRTVLLAGLRAVSGELVEDVALARHLAARGHRVDFLDATCLMAVRPYRSVGEVWSGWGRSIGLRGVEPWWRQMIESTILVATLVIPPVRVARRAGDVIDVAALSLRFGALVGTRRAYAPRGAAFWLSPLADPVALAATFTGLVRRAPTWRGRRLAPTAGRRRTGGRRTSSAPR